MEGLTSDNPPETVGSRSGPDDPDLARVDAALQAVFSRTQARQAQATAVVIAQSGTGVDLAEHAFAGAAGLADAAIDAGPGRAEHACKRGCQWCCHQLVRITACEAIAIAGILREHFTPPELARVRAVISSRAARIARLPTPVAYGPAGLPCAFLAADGACSIHAWRPLVCRGYASRSRSACEEWYIDSTQAPPPPLDRATRTVALGVLHGLQTGLAASGREAETCYELHHALLRALDLPDAAARWARGEPVFAGCLAVAGRKVD